jgi:hypothetical protein
MEENRACAARLGVGCVYSSPIPINAPVPANAVVFVVEMDNCANMVVALGMVRNTGRYNEHVIYADERYNTFTYLGRARIARADMTEAELKIMRALDVLCMSGAYHQKRLSGITRFPDVMLKRCARDTGVDLVAEVSAMFRRRAEKQTDKTKADN